MRQLSFFLTLIVLANAPALASSSDTATRQRRGLRALLPDFAQLQFAGHTGLFSVGLGYDLAHDRLHLSVLDGWMPRSVSKTKGINTVSLRLSGDIARLRLGKRLELRPYAGLATLFETTGAGFYSRLPDRYRDRRYYRNSAVHARCFAGAGIILRQRKGWIHSVSLYGETGTLDSYLFYNLQNGGRHFTEIFTAALGLVVNVGG